MTWSATLSRVVEFPDKWNKVFQNHVQMNGNLQESTFYSFIKKNINDCWFGLISIDFVEFTWNQEQVKDCREYDELGNPETSVGK